MTTAEFNTAREILRPIYTDAELAESLKVPVGTLREWSIGERKIPGPTADKMITLSDWARRQQALEESGLPECSWIKAQGMPTGKPGQREMMTLGRAYEKHMATCPTCTARNQYEERLFGRGPTKAPASYSFAFSAVVILAVLLIIAAKNDMLGEPMLWVVVAAVIALLLYPRLRHRR